MLTIYRCRQPGVKLLSMATIFNREAKLTPNGARLYLAFFALLPVGLLINFSGIPSTGNAISAIAQANAMRTESAEQWKARRFAEASAYYRHSTATIASLIPFNDSASSQLALCNTFAQTGVSNYQADMNTDAMRAAVRQCDRIARRLCLESAPPGAGRCRDYAVVSSKLINY